MPEKPDEHTAISWKAPEFLHYKKNYWWFPLQALATLGLTTYFVLTGQYLVAIIVVLAGIVIYQQAHREPEVLPVIFTLKGIRFKDIFWPFETFKTFWITEVGQTKVLHLQKIERFTVPLVIPLVKQDVAKVQDFLQHYLPETHDVTEDIADKLNRILKI